MEKPKLEALLLCCLFARLPRPAACPIASCQLPFWGANPFKFCLMSLNCCRCTSQAALRVSLSPSLSLSLALYVLCNVAASACNLYKCPKLSKMSVRMSRGRRNFYGQRQSWLHFATTSCGTTTSWQKFCFCCKTDRQTDSPEVAAVPAQVINTHVKRGNPERWSWGGGGVSDSTVADCQLQYGVWQVWKAAAVAFIEMTAWLAWHAWVSRRMWDRIDILWQDMIARYDSCELATTVLDFVGIWHYCFLLNH